MTAFMIVAYIFATGCSTLWHLRCVTPLYSRYIMEQKTSSNNDILLNNGISSALLSPCGEGLGDEGSLLLKALRKEKVERPPVWMMRQAGRYLPDYIKLRDKYDFFTRVQTPELATAITLQPVRQIGVDAAIIFSDILVIPQAMGVEVLMEEGKGPSLPQTVRIRILIH